MMYEYLNFFIAFQVMCLFIATAFTVANTYYLRRSGWFPVYAVYLFTIATMTVRRIIVLVEGRPGATAIDTMIWQTIIAVGFLVCSGMAYSLLKPKDL